MELTYTETLVVTRCWCGMALAIPENRHEWMQNSDQNGSCCPEGHRFVYREGKAKRLQRELDEERRRLRATRDLLAAEERSHVATRGHLTRARKRAQAGVCPCCHRTFQNVARHVATKHPDFEPAATP